LRRFRPPEDEARAAADRADATAEDQGNLMTNSGWRIGCDIGGTFTDFFAIDADGNPGR